MSSVGTYLRELRQRKGVSLEEIARTTRVAQRYLESIEADAFDALPSPVFTRGFIRAYCQALSEPPEEALAAYERREPDAPPPPAAAPRPSATARPSAPVPRPVVVQRPGAPASRPVEGEPRGRGAVLVSFVLLVVLGVALFGVALVIHPRDRSERVAATPRPEPRQESRPVRPPEPPTPAPAPATPPPARPTPPASAPPAAAPATPPAARPTPPNPPATVAAPTTPPAPPTVPPASTPGAPPPTATRPAPVAPTPPPGATASPAAVQTAPVPPNLDAVVGSVASPYRLVARTSEATWIRVRTEDGRMSEETVPPGEVREWISNRPFVLTIGNAGGVSLELNGRALPPLGPKGVVIQRIVLPPEAR